MFGLLSPIWLAGLAALAVPVALHLWSRRGGRPILVGSIRLLTGSPPATRRSWTVQDPWLLALRCAVLAALVVALAGPYWIPTAPTRRTVALVARDVANREALLDSLRHAGLRVAPLDSEAPASNLWAAIRRANRGASPGTRFLVFAPDWLRYFRGERPTLRASVEWHIRPVGPSGPVALPPPAARLVAILADPSRQDDARYVAAALGAAQAATGISAVVSSYPATTGAAADAVAAADWIVWLSDRAAPEPILQAVRRGAVLVDDAGGATPRPLHARVVTGPQPTDAWLIRRAPVAAAERGAPVWADGTGNPLLLLTREGRGLHYRFQSRFVPAWSDLVLRPAFPLAMARLWARDADATAEAEPRIALSQLLPAVDSGPQTAPPGPHRPLFVPVWLLAVLLFLTERWWSQRPRLTAR